MCGSGFLCLLLFFSLTLTGWLLNSPVNVSSSSHTHPKLSRDMEMKRNFTSSYFFCFRLKSTALMGFGVVSVFGNCLFSLGPVSAGRGICSIQSLQSNETDYSFSFSPIPPTNNNPGKQKKLNK